MRAMRGTPGAIRYENRPDVKRKPEHQELRQHPVTEAFSAA
jgi:hypothetical protein